MESLLEARHVSVSIQCPPSDVYAFVYGHNMVDAGGNGYTGPLDVEDPLLPPADSDEFSSTEETELTFEFTGNATEFFRIWIVNVCLTLLTLGVFSAWAKVRRQRYFYACTRLDSTPFKQRSLPRTL